MVEVDRLRSAAISHSLMLAFCEPGSRGDGGMDSLPDLACCYGWRTRGGISGSAGQ